jgi:hypothetical protein
MPLGRSASSADGSRFAELRDVLLGDAQLHGLEAARQLDRFGDARMPSASRWRREDRRRLAFGLVDLLLRALPTP